jgi:hypothetical protein
MALFKKNSNANSENRRRRRAQLLLNNKLAILYLESALFNKNIDRRKKYTLNVIRHVRGSPLWTPNLVPFRNAYLMNKLKIAYNNIKPELKKRNNNAAAARQARQTNVRRKANQHAAYLLTNEGKRWKQQNNERIRLQKQQNNEAARRRANANANMFGRTGYSMANFNYY